MVKLIPPVLDSEDSARLNDLTCQIDEIIFQVSKNFVNWQLKNNGSSVPKEYEQSVANAVWNLRKAVALIDTSNLDLSVEWEDDA